MSAVPSALQRRPPAAPALPRTCQTWESERHKSLGIKTVYGKLLIEVHHASQQGSSSACTAVMRADSNSMEHPQISAEPDEEHSWLHSTIPTDRICRASAGAALHNSCHTSQVDRNRLTCAGLSMTQGLCRCSDRQIDIRCRAPALRVGQVGAQVHRRALQPVTLLLLRGAGASHLDLPPVLLDPVSHKHTAVSNPPQSAFGGQVVRCSVL